MKKFILCGLLALASLCASAWGRMGHDAICYIAECNLSPKALKAINYYYDGRSIMYYSTWPDEVRLTPQYSYTTKWHCAYYDENDKAYLGKNFDSDIENAPDCLLQLGKMIDKLRDYKNLDKEEVATLLKFVCHWVGDIHCPTHTLYPGLKGFKVVYGGKTVSYHSVWDEVMIDDIHRWGYMEYGHEMGRLGRKEAKEVQKGWIVDWGEQTARDCHVIYEWAKPGDELYKDFYLQARPLADRQVQFAGYRLAKVLNEIFK